MNASARCGYHAGEAGRITYKALLKMRYFRDGGVSSVLDSYQYFT